MKRFIIKAAFFIFIFCSLVIGLDLLSARNTDFSEFLGKLTNSSEYSRYYGNTGTTEIIPVIEKVQQNDSYTKLIIGDSVCFQLFNDLQPVNEEYCIAGTNRAITLTGQYILTEEFLANHPNATDVYLILIPDTFDAYFDNTFGYSYAVMPFVQTDTFSLLDQNTIETAEETYGKLFIRKDIIDFIDYSCINRKLYFNYVKEYVEAPENGIEIASKQAVQYLTKISSLCQEHNVTLHLLPGPIADSKERHEQLNRQENAFRQNNLEDVASQYFENISFYPEGQFRDGTHLGGDYAARDAINQKIIDLQNKSGELADLLLQVE